MFGTRADGLSKILTKGSKVAIDGKLRWSQWEKDGQKRSKVEIIVDSLDFMSQRNNNQSAAAPAAPAAPSATETIGAGEGATPASEPVAEVEAESYGEDIPF